MGTAGLNRRQFLRAAGAGAAIGLVGGCAGATRGDVAPKSARRVVVVGGGWGGATAAKYVRLHDPSIEVILFEPNREFKESKGASTAPSEPPPRIGSRRRSRRSNGGTPTQLPPGGRPTAGGGGSAHAHSRSHSPYAARQEHGVPGTMPAGIAQMPHWVEQTRTSG